MATSVTLTDNPVYSIQSAAITQCEQAAALRLTRGSGVCDPSDTRGLYSDPSHYRVEPADPWTWQLMPGVECRSTRLWWLSTPPSAPGSPYKPSIRIVTSGMLLRIWTRGPGGVPLCLSTRDYCRLEPVDLGLVQGSWGVPGCLSTLDYCTL